MSSGANVRYDPVWRRIKADPFSSKFEGKFPDRFRRLEKLNNWGSLSWLYPHATATKQAHHLGVERNAVEFLRTDASRQRHEASFRTAAHVVHWGHLPLSYAGAEAIFRAARVDPGVQQVLDEIIGEVVTFGDLDCDDTAHQAACAEKARRGYSFAELYKWLSAWILSENWSAVWNVIRSASSDEINKNATKRSLVRALVCREDPGYRLLSRCNLADYVPRDLLQCGTAWLTIDIEAIWETNPLSPSDAAAEWTLLDAAHDYLDTRFYSDPTSLLVHTLAARSIAQGLLSTGLRRSELRALLSNSAGDAAYSTLPDPHRRRLRDVENDAQRGTLANEWWHVGSFRSVSLPADNRLVAEAELTGRAGTGQLSYPFTADYSVVVETDAWANAQPSLAGESRAYGTVHLHHRRRSPTDATAFPALSIAAQAASWVEPRVPEQIGDGVLSWLLRQRVEQRSSGLYRVAGEIVNGDHDYFKRRLRKLRKRPSLKALNTHESMAFWCDMIADGAPLGGIFAGSFILRLPWRAASSAPGQEMLIRLRDRAVARALDTSDPARGDSLEVAVVAGQLLAPRGPDLSYRLIAFGSTLLSSIDGRPSAEWDVIRIDLAKDRTWSIAATECTISRNASKDSKDREKLEQLRSAVQSKWSDLRQYETYLATALEEKVHLEDAGRGFTAHP